MSLQPPEMTRKLQETLHAKAKGSPGYRFYLLYDKVYREDVLTFAYQRCKANGGGAGTDGQHFEDIETDGGERWLAELAEALRTKAYRPQAVRRIYIPKPDGRKTARWGSRRSGTAWCRWRWGWSWNRFSRPT